MSMLTIVGVAIRVEEDQRIYAAPAPARHHNVIRMVAAAGNRTPINEGSPAYTFGFLLADASFVDRIEGERIARQTGQLAIPNIGGPMTSEDLW